MEFGLERIYDDAFAECLYVLYKSILRFNDSGFTFYSFFLAGLNNRLISLQREERRHEKVIINETEYLEEPHENIAGAISASELFRGLTEKEKLIIDLRYFKKKTAREIARDYDLTLYQVYNTIKMAKKKIKDNI